MSIYLTTKSKRCLCNMSSLCNITGVCVIWDVINLQQFSIARCWFSCFQFGVLYFNVLSPSPLSAQIGNALIPDEPQDLVFPAKLLNLPRADVLGRCPGDVGHTVEFRACLSRARLYTNVCRTLLEAAAALGSRSAMPGGTAGLPGTPASSVGRPMPKGTVIRG